MQTPFEGVPALQVFCVR